MLQSISRYAPPLPQAQALKANRPQAQQRNGNAEEKLAKLMINAKAAYLVSEKANILKMHAQLELGEHFTALADDLCHTFLALKTRFIQLTPNEQVAQYTTFFEEYETKRKALVNKVQEANASGLLPFTTDTGFKTIVEMLNKATFKS